MKWIHIWWSRRLENENHEKQVHIIYFISVQWLLGDLGQERSACLNKTIGIEVYISIIEAT